MNSKSFDSCFFREHLKHRKITSLQTLTGIQALGFGLSSGEIVTTNLCSYFVKRKFKVVYGAKLVLSAIVMTTNDFSNFNC